MTQNGLQSQGQSLKAEDLLITHELDTRPLRPTNWPAETDAFHNLAQAMVQHPEALLKRFATLAVDLCNAGSAGISLLRTKSDGESVFLWAALAGAFTPYEGGTTPRDFSPCGMCLDRGAPILVSYPARLFSYFEQADAEIVEGLIVPLYRADGQPLGTIWVVTHDPNRRLCREDVRTMVRLGNFTVLALHMIEAAESRERLFQQLTHRTKNILASVQAFALSTRVGSASVDEYATKLTSRFRAMGHAHDLLANGAWKDASLRSLVDAILQPDSYNGAYDIDGEDIRLGERTTRALAMALDELATNACKYGALSAPRGKICIRWALDEQSGDLTFLWTESRGPPVEASVRSGFGMKVIEMSIQRTLGGHARCDFQPTGLRCEWRVPLVGNA